MIVEHIPQWVETGLSSDLSFAVLLFVFVLEGAMLLYVVPSELIVPAALVLIGDSYARAVAIILTATLGATTGQLLLFIAAEYLGREKIVESRWFPVSDKRITKFENWFRKYGTPAIPVSNSLLLVRGTMTIPAGLSKLSVKKFAVLSAIGTIVFETLLTLLYYLGVVIFL